MSRISDKLMKFSLNYSTTFWGSLVIQTECSSLNSQQYTAARL